MYVQCLFMTAHEYIDVERPSQRDAPARFCNNNNVCIQVCLCPENGTGCCKQSFILINYLIKIDAPVISTMVIFRGYIEN